MRMRSKTTRLTAVLFLTALAACSTPEKKGGGGDDDLGGGGRSGDRDSGGSAEASASRVTFTNSLSNNPLTSQTVNDSKAESELQRFQGGKDKRALEGRISAERLAKKNASEVLASAKRLADLEMGKGAGRTISDEAKLEVALAALQSRNFALAEYFLQDLMTDAKNARVKAGAFNAMGVIALRDDRVPEAVLYFKEALKAVSNYKPALLNLGFTALKGGDFGAAKSALGGLANDWFVQYGLITVARLEGNEGRAEELCENVLKREPGHGGVLFNCGLFEYQNRHNAAKAKEYLNRAGKAHGEPGWGEKAFILIAQIDREQAEAKQKAATAAKAKAKASAKSPAGGQPQIEQKPEQ